MSCSTSQYATKSEYVRALSQSPNIPDIQAFRKYVNQISEKLDSCIITYDPLIDFWDKMVLLPLEPYVLFNDEWMAYLDQKSKEYVDVLLPECKAIILNGFDYIGVKPKEKTFHFLRAEFILACIDNPNYDRIRIVVFNRLTDKIEGFFMPIYRKAIIESENNQQELNSILRQENRDLSFWKVYELLYNYGLQEEAKLRMRDTLDRKYSPIIEAEMKKFINDLKPAQKEKSILIAQTDANIPKFLKSLTPEQYVLIERIINKAAYIQHERKICKERVQKYVNLVEWIKANKEKAQLAKMQDAQIKAARAEAIVGGLLMGFATALLAYTAWRNAYYNSYRVRQFQIYDNFGNFYHGTVW